MHPSESNGYLVTVTCKAQSFLPYSDAVLFFTLPPSLPAGNQTASLTTNNLERPIFWCHLVFSFVAFILMWLVAQEPPVRGWQFMGCKTLVKEKRTRDREEKSLVWCENPSALSKKLQVPYRWCFSSLQGVEELTQRTKIHKKHDGAPLSKIG